MGRTLQPGDRIAHYKIIGPLGAGGMGEVYLASDQTLERDVALKVLPAELVRSEDRVKRFVMEARSASSLSHPHIVTIHEIGHDRVRSVDASDEKEEEIHYIAMERVKGKTLKDLIHHEKTDLKTMLGHLAQAAEGLSKAHASGIVHRDLKPGNIMVTDDGYAKVLDFGLAKLTERGATEADMTSAPTAIGEGTEAGAIVGTVGYMSPEQVKGKRVDPRSDIFSFGCILYEAATRRRPFAAESNIDTMHKIVHETPPPVDEINPEVPSELRRLIRRCLAKSPDQRFQAIKDLAIELREIVDEYDALSATATSGSAIAAPALAARRSAALTAGIAIAAVLGVAGIAFGIWSILGRGAAEPTAGRPFQNVHMTSLMSDSDLVTTTISSDGRYLAYVKGPAGRWSLWVRQVATGSEAPILAPQLVPIRGVSFSPDGDYLYYLGRDTETPEYSALFEVPSLGGNPRKRIFDIDSAISFAPDGHRVTFLRGVPQNNEDHLMVADLETGEERALAVVRRPAFLPQQRPSWSPDGQRIVTMLVTTEGGFKASLAGFDAETGERGFVTEPAAVELGGATWLPDGRGLIGLSQQRRGQPLQAFFFPYPEGKPYPVTNDLDQYGEVSVSSDGKSISAMRRSREGSLWVVPVHGAGQLRQITSRSTKEGIDDLLPLDGGAIAFAATKDRHRHIWTITEDRPEKRQVTSQAGWSSGLRSLPGGGGFVFTHFGEEESTGHVWRVDSDGGNLRRLTDGDGEWVNDLSPDGRTILMARTGFEDQLWKISVDGGDPEMVVDDYIGGSASYSPDGRLIAYARQEEIEGRFRPVIVLIPAGGGEPIASFVPPGGAADFEWLPDGSAATYIHAVDGVQNVWKQPVGGTGPTQVTTFTEGRLLDHALSPDGRRIALIRLAGDARDVWMVDADGGDPAPLTDFRTGQIFDMAWARDGQSLVVHQGDLRREVVLITQAQQ